MLRHSSSIIIASVFLLPCTGIAAEPDGITVPPGFHVSVAVDSIAGARHLAFRTNGDLFVSTRGAKASGIVAIRLGPDHKAQKIETFGSVTGGTGIRVYRDKLFASSPTGIYRYSFRGKELVPSDSPDLIVDGMPSNGFTARPIAFDVNGNLFVGIGGGGNTCVDEKLPTSSPPAGLNPCPDLASRAGIWRFSATIPGQRFPVDGLQFATGVRDIGALEWRDGAGLFGIVHDRNGLSRTWPNLVTSADEQAIPEAMHKIDRGADLGWPYAYFDTVRGRFLIAPEYGGDGKTAAVAEKYSQPAASFPGHSSPLDLVFYNGRQFPKEYRGGAFVIFHGGLGPDLPDGHNGYNIVFLPFNKQGRPGKQSVFVDGFAGATLSDKNVSRAKYRPVGAAVGPDGALYVADSKIGRVWRISYGE